MMNENHDYRGYVLRAILNHPRWQVGIYPQAPHLPRPNPIFQFVEAATKEDALEAAKRRVDELLDRPA